MEYLATEVIEEYGLPTPLIWIDHYPEPQSVTQESVVELPRSGVLSEQDAKGVVDRAIADVGGRCENEYNDPLVSPLLPGRLQWLWPQCLPWPGRYLLPAGCCTTSGS